MPELREVFDTATQKVRPHPGALQRQHHNQRRLVIKRKIGAYVAVAGIVVAGMVGGYALQRSDSSRPGINDPSPPGITPSPSLSEVRGLEPTPSRLAGIWLAGGPSAGWDTLMIRFDRDGTFAADDAGRLDTNPGGKATYEVDGHTITLTYGSDPGTYCVEGERLVWDAALPEEGRLHTVVVEGGCNMGAETELIFTRVSPISPAGSELTTEGPPEGLGPPADPFAIRGIWLLQGGGQLLRINFAGAYATDDGGRLGVDPDDVGTIDVDQAGNITFTSGPGSRECAEGDVMVWTDVQHSGDALRGVVSEDSCRDRVGTEWTWVRISP